ncbi:MAG: tryptophan synthase subunit alpha [Pseudohongiellaceae bacterium]
MSRIQTSIAAGGRKLLIPYLVAGDPNAEATVALMHAMAEAGADIIELGIPFSDPASDGPVIQQGAERALAGGTAIADVLDMVAEFRRGDRETPVVLMGYLNPLETMGCEVFADRAREAGVDGVLVVDMPPGEAQPLSGLLRDRAIDTIFLVSPTTTDTRARAIIAQCSGYLYYVSLKGVTGAALTDSSAIAARLEQLRQFTDLPVVIGFGIKDGPAAAMMADLADGVVVGSAIVERIAKLPVAEGNKGYSARGLEPVVDLIREMRNHIDKVR